MAEIETDVRQWTRGGVTKDGDIATVSGIGIDPDDTTGRVRREFLERAVIALADASIWVDDRHVRIEADEACSRAEHLLVEMQRRGWMP